MRKKTISTIDDLGKKLKLNLNNKDKKDFKEFFKNRFINLDQRNNIIFPRKKDFKKRNNTLKEELKKLNKLKKFWKKRKKNAKNYFKRIQQTKFFKKNYWKHKIKKITNDQYKQDIKDTNLNEEILMDPQYKHLLNAFLVDPDYRDKLKKTVNNSIIYKKKSIGDTSKRKQNFKEELSIKNLEKINKKIKKIKLKLKANKNILDILSNKFKK